MDGIIVLSVAQPPRQNRSRITSISLRFKFAHCLYPVDDALPKFDGRMLFGFLRRHFGGLEFFEDSFPPPVIFRNGLAAGVSPQIQLSLLLLLPGTAEAI